jgi:rSAM/selenodomain-associated transferase 2
MLAPPRVPFWLQLALRGDVVITSIVIPALNEECSIGATLEAVARLHGSREVIVVDGGSTDRTVEIAARYGRVIQSGRGRGKQQAAGAKIAAGDVLWFLHADTIPPPSALEAIDFALRDQRIGGGNFKLCFDGEVRSARQLTIIYPYLRILGLCYGDSAIFVRRSVYETIGGFRDHPLFEDIDLVRRLRKVAEFKTLPVKVVTSSRRFEHRNFAGMFAVWTLLQVLYWAGVSPERLARLYAPVRRRQTQS